MFDPWVGRSPGEGNDYPLQYSGLEKCHGSYSPWGYKESDMTEQLSLSSCIVSAIHSVYIFCQETHECDDFQKSVNSPANWVRCKGGVWLWPS